MGGTLASGIASDPERLEPGLRLLGRCPSAGATWLLKEEPVRRHVVAVIEGCADIRSVEAAARTGHELREPDEFWPLRVWLVAREIPQDVLDRGLELHVRCRDFPSPHSISSRIEDREWKSSNGLDPRTAGYYLTPIANLQSILRSGIQCRNRAQRRRVIVEDFSITLVQSKRARRIVVGSRTVWDFVPLFVHPRNPALYRLAKRGWSERLAILEIAATALATRPFLTAGHALRFDPKPHPEGAREHAAYLSKWPGWNLRSWLDPDRDAMRLKRSLLQAEVLIPTSVSALMVRRVIVASRSAAAAVRVLVPPWSAVEEIVIYPDLFFAGPREF